MSESLFSRAAAVTEPRPAAGSAEAPIAEPEAPRGIALRRTPPRRVLAEAAVVAPDDAGERLAQLVVDRPTPAPRAGGWRALFGGGR